MLLCCSLAGWQLWFYSSVWGLALCGWCGVWVPPQAVGVLWSERGETPTTPNTLLQSNPGVWAGNGALSVQKGASGRIRELLTVEAARRHQRDGHRRRHDGHTALDPHGVQAQRGRARLPFAVSPQ